MPPLQVRGSLLASLEFVGALVFWVMLIMFVLMVVRGSLVEVSVRFLGLYRPFREVSFGSVILALQSSGAVHLGLVNLNVVQACWSFSRRSSF